VHSTQKLHSNHSEKTTFLRLLNSSSKRKWHIFYRNFEVAYFFMLSFLIEIVKNFGNFMTDLILYFEECFQELNNHCSSYILVENLKKQSFARILSSSSKCVWNSSMLFWTTTSFFFVFLDKRLSFYEVGRPVLFGGKNIIISSASCFFLVSLFLYIVWEYFYLWEIYLCITSI